MLPIMQGACRTPVSGIRGSYSKSACMIKKGAITRLLNTSEPCATAPSYLLASNAHMLQARCEVCVLCSKPR